MLVARRRIIISAQHKERFEPDMITNLHSLSHLDICSGADDGTPDSFIKAILDTQTYSIDPYARTVVDHYILNVSEDDSNNSLSTFFVCFLFYSYLPSCCKEAIVVRR